MGTIQTQMVEELAVQLARGRRVLLVEPSFDFLSRVATQEVKELVVISKDVDPEGQRGETPTGAPLRLRPDWKERPRSKDLVVVPAGKTNWTEIDRLLKKAGIVLSPSPRRKTTAFPFITTIKTTVSASYRYDNSGQSSPDLPEGPSIFACSREAITIPPFAIDGPALAPGESGQKQAEIEAISSQLTATKAEQAKLEQKVASLEAEKSGLETALQTAQKKNSAQRGEIDKLTADKDQLTSDFQELENEYDQVRADLAEARVVSKRLRDVETRTDDIRQQMNAEIESLQQRLRELDGTGVDFERVHGERGVLLENFDRTLDRVGSLLKLVIGGQALPATPKAGTTDAQLLLVQAWLDTVDRRAHQAAERRTSTKQELRSLKDKLKRLQKKLLVLENDAKKPAERVTDMPRAIPPVPVLNSDDTTAQVEALTDALDAERRRREIAERVTQDVRQSTQFALDDRHRLLEEINQYARRLHEAELKRVIAEENQILTNAELSERALRINEFEAMLLTHDQVQQLMSRAIEEAQDARDEADDARRLAEENLRIMRSEFERLQSRP
ncbi:MAG: hypothetical protein ACON3Z_14355 [Bradymonadia bacterium]